MCVFLVCRGGQICESVKRVIYIQKDSKKRRIYFVHILVSIFGNSSMQVSERVSLNKFHFMHEYRDISV